MDEFVDASVRGQKLCTEMVGEIMDDDYYKLIPSNVGKLVMLTGSTRDGRGVVGGGASMDGLVIMRRLKGEYGMSLWIWMIRCWSIIIGILMCQIGPQK